MQRLRTLYENNNDGSTGNKDVETASACRIDDVVLACIEAAVLHGGSLDGQRVLVEVSGEGFRGDVVYGWIQDGQVVCHRH